MKTIRETINARTGKRRLVLELDPNNESILVVKHGEYYRLGGQVSDVVGAHVIAEAEHVYWCSISQQWESSK